MLSPQPPYFPEKALWTEADFEVMGWHDAQIHSLSFQWDGNAWTGDLVFDIDYIFKWVDPLEGREHFSFWIAPCTLVFTRAFDLDLNIKTGDYAVDTPSILELELLEKTAYEEGTSTYKWLMELDYGQINLTSEGFTQIVRRPPLFTGVQQLTPEQRGGISFDRTPFRPEGK